MLKVEQFECIRHSYRIYDLLISKIARKIRGARKTIQTDFRNEHCSYEPRSINRSRR
ncbi:hypothetical protein Dret_1541 [Desulfohalobium retbaense DSM 5692]|uniref:Uncharacterized protein n=1 Tax=Desulfohalobium retbaense (strain ATCC 49708 / DSM 5692 / JCM 16813 / HR100) TaxID=485915 RepID=C8X330_DESRD|nr:hypothetical protein Dret_1541 [Desulfohalobium retbaense DSM 5692]